MVTNRRSNILLRILLDAAMCGISVLLAAFLLPIIERIVTVEAESPGVSVFGRMIGYFFPLLVALFLLSDLYDIPRMWNPSQIFRRLFTIMLLLGCLYLTLSIFFPQYFRPSLKAVLLTGAISMIALWLVRVYLPENYGRQIRKRKMLLVGAHTFAVRALQRFSKEHPEDVEIVGVVDSFKKGVYFENLEIDVLGDKRSLPSAIRDREVDTLLILNDQTEYANDVIDLIQNCPTLEEIYIRAQIPLVVAQDIEISFVQEVPLLKLYSRASGYSETLTRAIFDRIGAAILGFVTLPLVLMSGLMIKLESKGPIFYRQKRLGLGNRPFWIYKLRSMVTDAEKRSGAVLATKNDPRVTRVGRFLRATRLDEIPQLINVMKGEMSLIGPRPERPEFQHIYEETIPWYPLRSLCKPGLTGLAQVSGDYHTSTQRKLLYDVSYLANMSPLLDMKILIATVMTVLTKQGH